MQEMRKVDTRRTWIEWWEWERNAEGGLLEIGKFVVHTFVCWSPNCIEVLFFHFAFDLTVAL